jgi:hypothetical protein
MLLAGELNLSVVSMVADILTTGNADEILSGIGGRSFRDVELLVARHRPGGIIRDRVRPVCVMMPCKEPGHDPPDASLRASDVNMNPRNILSGADVSSTAGSAISTPDVGCEKSTGYEGERAETAVGGDARTGCGAPAHMERMLVTQKYKLEFAVDPEFMRDLERARNLLSAKYPDGIGFETLFGILLKEYLDRHDPERRIRRRKKRKDRDSKRIVSGNGKQAEKQKTIGKDSEGESERGRCSDTREMPDKRRSICADTRAIPKKRRGARCINGRTRHIPRAVRDRVHVRDGGRCTFIGTDGKRCNSYWNLEIDHIVPFAKGGDNSLDNLRLLCAEHNRLAAEKEYGKDHMDEFYR